MIALVAVSAIDMISDAVCELETATRPYAMVIGQPVDAIDREHVEKALKVLKLLLAAQKAAA